ncbi:MAG TPA: L-sorbose 1-phosphate reductase, partial [Eubacteriaceae bacterium]|nr:L-sorbose 1-phosphate reductase [Eubacteriaceae bacterium]
MDVTSIRLYGKKDLRREKWSLPDIKEDEILALVMVDSVCMSTYKAVLQGETHRRVNDDIKTRPVIIGHETSCVLEKVGAKWQNHYCEGMTVALQPDLQLKDSMATIGYSFEYCGGLSTYVVLPNVVMEAGALLPFDPEQGYYAGALVEPISAVLASYKSMYHVDKGSKIHQMDIKKGGRMALLGSGGPMGFAAVSAALHRESKPSLLVASDLMEERLEKIRKIFGGKYQGIPIYYVQASGNKEEDIKALLEQSPDGFDDVGVFAPVTDLVEIADR